jgi:hypothetical protein
MRRTEHVARIIDMRNIYTKKGIDHFWDIGADGRILLKLIIYSFSRRTQLRNVGFTFSCTRLYNRSDQFRVLLNCGVRWNRKVTAVSRLLWIRGFLCNTAQLGGWTENKRTLSALHAVHGVKETRRIHDPLHVPPWRARPPGSCIHQSLRRRAWKSPRLGNLLLCWSQMILETCELMYVHCVINNFKLLGSV